MYVSVWLQQMWHMISDYYLENTPESVSEHLFFKISWGDASKSPSCSMLRMFSCVLRTTHFQIHLLCRPYHSKLPCSAPGFNRITMAEAQTIDCIDSVYNLCPDPVSKTAGPETYAVFTHLLNVDCSIRV